MSNQQAHSMKALVITNLFPNAHEPNRGIFRLQQYAALSQYFQLRVVAPVAWRPWAQDRRGPVPREEDWSGIPTVHPSYFYTPGAGRAAYALWMYLSIRKIVREAAREFRPDVLLAAWAYPDAVATAAFARQMELPYMVQICGSDINVMATAPLVRKQIRWALCRASRTVAVSHALKESLIDIGVPEQAVRVLHNGIDTQRFRLQDRSTARERTGLPQDRRIVVYVGNLKASKGTCDLLDAAQLLSSETKLPPLIVLVGDGPDRGRLEEQIRHASLQEHVLLAGPRPHAQVPDWIAASDALCLPSHREGCPNVVLEALACGRPVVATTVGAVPDFIDERSGALVAPRAPEQLAKAMQAVIQQEWHAEALRQRVERLSWDENARTLAGELADAVSSHHRPLTPGGERAPERAPEAWGTR